MAIPMALMAAGTALQVFGQYQANMAQAQAELLNAEFYGKQADFAKESEFRQSTIASNEYEMRKGAQLSAYGKGGVDISGSASMVVANTLAAKVEELNAIKLKGSLEYSLAKSRSRQSSAQAAMLQSLDYNLVQAGGTVLGNAAKATDNNPNSALGQWILGLGGSGSKKSNPGLGTPYSGGSDYNFRQADIKSRTA